jgi:hypothetical protein
MTDRRPQSRFEPQDVRQVHSRFQRIFARAIRREGATVKQLKKEARASALRVKRVA